MFKDKEEGLAVIKLVEIAEYGQIATCMECKNYL